MAEHEPWLRRADWARRRVVYSHLRDGLGLLIFAIVWCGFTSLFATLAIRDTDSLFRWLILFFPAIGLFLLLGGIRATIQGLRYGTSTLVLESVPQEPGGVFRARVESARFPEGTIRAAVQCVHRSGKDRKVLWRSHHEIARSALLRLPEGTAVPIRFQIPADVRETESIAPNEEILWQLILGFGGTDAAAELSCHFDIPVFARRSAER